MNPDFGDILSARELNALATAGAFFLCLLISRLYAGTRRDRAFFFLFGGLGWLFNLVYLVVSDLSFLSAELSHQSSVLVIFSANTIGMFFFLLATRQRYSVRYPKFSSLWLVSSATVLVLCFPLIVQAFFQRAFWFAEVLVVSFSAFAIGAFGRTYQTYFQSTRQPLTLTAKYCLVLSLYLYALLQFGYLFGMYSAHLFLGGMILKLVHLFGLMQFSESFFVDYREKAGMYEQARQSRQLADQLAHELNTPAVEMRLRLSSLEQKCRDPEAVLAQISRMGNLLEQLTALVDSFRSFQHGRSLDSESTTPRLCNVNRICESAIMTLKLVLRPNVRFVRSYCPRPLVSGVESRLFQVFKNIIKNAIEATQDSEYARIVVITEVMTDESNMPLHVRVRIQDNGPGIYENILPKIFEEGFSIKSSPGHGFGLYIAMNIVKEHQGTIHVKPKGAPPYRGACFEVRLPYSSGSV